ncbi:MAG: Gfo/Idh/MocA family oxidoreductase [Planctomycetaceae bacterium]|nr:Gfo/Idh/MocA family oxidoreductase [Planctomycetaceae bacterium]
MQQHAISRRCFVKRTAGAAAGMVAIPYIVRSSALGLGGSVAPSNRLAMAQIGCGSMGTGNLKSFLSLGNALQFVAVCDVDSQRAAETKRLIDETYGNSDCRVYKDYRELLEKEKLDVVSHAVPDHWHAAIAVACARKGIDMYGEKPLARSIKEGRAISDAVSRYGIIWQTGSWQRSRRDFHHAAELVRNGRIGKVDYIEVGLPNGSSGPEAMIVPQPDTLDWDFWLGPAPWRPYQNFSGRRGRGGPHWDWRWILDYSGGQLTDWAGHHIDIAHWGMGLDYSGPVEVEGKGEFPSKGIWDAPYAYDFTCTYEGGLKLRVANEAKQPRGMGVCWYGQDGWIHVDRSGLWASKPEILREKIGANEIRLYKSEDHHRNLIECVKSRRLTIAPAEVALRSITVGLLGEIAMLTGRKLKWDPAKEEFIGDEGASGYLMRSYRSPWHL